MSTNEPTVTVNRGGRGRLRWQYDLWWDDADEGGHGIGGWAWTRSGARFAAARTARANR